MNEQAEFYDDMTDRNLVIEIKKKEQSSFGISLGCHWHNQIQFYYFTHGVAKVCCDLNKFEVHEGDIAIINSKELHYIENCSEYLSYYIIKIDLSFLYSNKVDSIQMKILSPLSQNLILFENLVRADKNILGCIHRMIEEYYKRDVGFELAIKAQIYDLIVHLLRGYTKKFIDEYELHERNEVLQRFKKVIEYMDQNYTEKTDLQKLSKMVEISTGHFCRLFKQITGMSAMNYMNDLRLNKAVNLIKNSNLNMTEIAMCCGFNDSNYFSRVFKKHRKISPMQFRRLSV